MQKMELGEHFDSFFTQPIIKNGGSDGFVAAGLAKNKFFTDMIGLLRPKTAINLC
jgi:hypothetical protein